MGSMFTRITNTYVVSIGGAMGPGYCAGPRLDSIHFPARGSRAGWNGGADPWTVGPVPAPAPCTHAGSQARHQDFLSVFDGAETLGTDDKDVDRAPAVTSSEGRNPLV